MKTLNCISRNTKPQSNLFLALIFGLILMSSNYATAQDKMSLSLRGGANFPTTDLGDVQLKSGFGFEGTFAYRFMPHLSTYAGWSWNRFSAKDTDIIKNLEFEETGYTFGLQFIHPFPGSKIKYMAGGGATYNHIETESKDGEITNDTGHGFGWQVEGGITIPLSTSLDIMPGVRYRSLTREMGENNLKTDVNLNYISAGASIIWSF